MPASRSIKAVHSSCTCCNAAAALEGSKDRVPSYLFGGHREETAKLLVLVQRSSSKKLACSGSNPDLSSPASSWNCWCSPFRSQQECLTISSSSAAQALSVAAAMFHWSTCWGLLISLALLAWCFQVALQTVRSILCKSTFLSVMSWGQSFQVPFFSSMLPVLFWDPVQNVVEALCPGFWLVLPSHPQIVLHIFAESCGLQRVLLRKREHFQNNWTSAWVLLKGLSHWSSSDGPACSTTAPGPPGYVAHQCSALCRSMEGALGRLHYLLMFHVESPADNQPSSWTTNQSQRGHKPSCTPQWVPKSCGKDSWLPSLLPAWCHSMHDGKHQRGSGKPKHSHCIEYNSMLAYFVDLDLIYLSGKAFGWGQDEKESVAQSLPPLLQCTTSHQLLSL